MSTGDHTNVKTVFYLVLLCMVFGVAVMSYRGLGRPNYVTSLSSGTDLVQVAINPQSIANVNTTASCRRPPKHFPTPVAFLHKLQPALEPSCDKLFDGQHSERQRVRNAQKHFQLPSDAEILKAYSKGNCSFVQNDFDNNFYVSPDEIDFPIAYEMLIYYQKNRFLQALNLLKFIYRPHNVYCIHIDKGSPQWWINGVKGFTSCLPNVFVAKKLVKIYYGSVSILDAHLSCLSELLTVTTPWKDIVKKLVELKGHNIVTKGFNASDPKSGYAYNWLMAKKVVPGSPPGKVGPLPNFPIYKSAESINSALSRDFVKYALTDSKSIALRKRLEYTQSAEEFFFDTLNMLKDAPGNFMKLKAAGLKLPRFSRRLWAHMLENGDCIDRNIRHNICIVSASDLPFIMKEMKTGLWFYNKYLIDYDHVVNDCIQLLLIQNNFKRYKQDCY
ncbi:PREDICTED: N-acetyllactosaminide beta-1,6-N-acetylglucosaminyl-transferase-like isoform X3 [Amphimedon queenslandica]|uniref:Protein xylosyltransferase n=1 Tax=Amphimedon queenslandica TaxID=400682 RepID=A0AAN0JHE3_AMPQE|nr:PREDICTED: N-acetyllactosaminide beta-1,6-N-acetylglucosaminyl-transferase-like isoform X3 [Amphimedon queenslandica]|eukprot:XP_019856216.1 PREDICTED: N-acetyllactosaminide beta-1,6-N-acetylglucosaminyl-transferase-like isoform X3 [Amphimedon queenslandica]